MISWNTREKDDGNEEGNEAVYKTKQKKQRKETNEGDYRKLGKREGGRRG